MKVRCSEVSTGLQIFTRTSTVWRTKPTSQSFCVLHYCLLSWSLSSMKGTHMP
ncbi:unnamed protein product [Natator depressus]